MFLIGTILNYPVSLHYVAAFKIVHLLFTLKKILQLKSKLIFLNKTQKGHYDKKPKEIKKVKTIEYYTDRPHSFKNSLYEIINLIKEKKF